VAQWRRDIILKRKRYSKGKRGDVCMQVGRREEGRKKKVVKGKRDEGKARQGEGRTRWVYEEVNERTEEAGKGRRGDYVASWKGV